MPTDTTPELPALPEGGCASEYMHNVRVFSEREIREYALAAIAADRASASRATPDSTEPKPESPAELAAAIRAPLLTERRILELMRIPVDSAGKCHLDGNQRAVFMARAVEAEVRAALATSQASSAPLARPVSGEAWISVDERLPKEWTKVWIANFDDVQEAVFDHTEGKFQVEDVYGAYENAYGVTHWMLRVPPAAPTSTPSTAKKD